MIMTFWKFNTFICLVDIILFCLCILRGLHLLKTRYPEVKWARLTHWSTTVMSVLKVVLASACPLFNLSLLYTMVTKDKTIIENSVEETYREQMKFQQKMEENQNV